MRSQNRNEKMQNMIQNRLTFKGGEQVDFIYLKNLSPQRASQSQSSMINIGLHRERYIDRFVDSTEKKIT